MSFLTKLALIFLAMIALAVGGVYLVVTNGTLQKQFVTAFLPPEAELEAIQLKLSSGKIEGFSIPIEGGGMLKIDRGEFRYRPFAWLFGQTAHIDTFRAEGLVIQLPEIQETASTTPSSETASTREDVVTEPGQESSTDSTASTTDPTQKEDGPPVPENPLRLNDIALKFVMREVSVDGEIIDANGDIRFTFSCKGGDFAPGSTGELIMVANISQGPDQNSAAEVEVTTRLAQSRNGRIELVSASAEGMMIPAYLIQLPIFADHAATFPQELGPGSFAMHFEATPDVISLEAANLLWKTVDGRDALRVGLTQPIQTRYPDNTWILEQPDAPVAEIYVDHFSTSWLNPFLEDTWSIADDGITGQSRLYYEDGRTRAEGLQAFQVKALRLEKDGELLLPPTDFKFAFNTEFDDSNLAFSESSIEISTDGEVLLFTELTGLVPLDQSNPKIAGVEIAGDLQIDLSLLSKQPYAEELLIPLETGTLAANFTHDAGNPGVGFTMDLRDIRTSREDRSPALELTLSGRAIPGETDAESRLELAGQLGPQRASRATNFQSDLTVLAENEATRFEGSFYAPLIRIDDINRLTSLFPVGEEPEEETPVDAPLKPLWKGFVGAFSLVVDELELADGSTLEGLGADLEIEPQFARVNNLRASAGAGSIEGSASIEMPEPSSEYFLQGALQLTEFDPGLLLNSGKSFTSAFNGQATLSGQGPTLPVALDAVETNLSLEARQGRLTLLDLEMPAANAAMFGLRLIGGASPGGRFDSLSKAIPYFNEINFDELQIDLNRSAAGKIDLSKLNLAGPFINLQGSGSVSPGPWRDMMTRPMSMHLQMGAKDELAGHLNTLGLLSETPNQAGYLPLKNKIELGGTLENPNASELQSLLVDAAISSFTGTGNESQTDPEAPQSDLERGLQLLDGLLGP